MPGFLGTRGTLMLDLVVVAMAITLPALACSIYLVRARKQYAAHMRIQLILSAVLLVAIALFELEMRLVGWEQRAADSPWSRAGRWNDIVEYLLIIHLLAAIPTFFVWAAVVVRAIRNFPRPPGPNAHSRSHRVWGRLAAIGMALTTVTGWLFYYAAFVRS